MPRARSRACFSEKRPNAGRRSRDGGQNRGISHARQIGVYTLKPDAEPNRAGGGAEVAVSGDDDVLTVEEAQKLLKIGRTALYAAIARNQIPHRRVGKQIRFSRAALMVWLSSWSLQVAQEGKK